MSSVAVLEKSKHNAIRIDVSKKISHVANQRLMPVVLSEFQRCANHFPIILTKNGETEKFVCAAVFGFDQGENLFLEEVEATAAYAPLNIQRQPFLLVNRNEEQSEAKPEDFVLCIDESSPCITEEETGQALFENDEPTDYIELMQKTFSELLKGEKQTEAFVDKMVEMDLIAPLTLNFAFNNEGQQRIDGAYTINEEKLNKLDSAQVYELHNTGYLGIIYTIYVSLGQFYPLITRKNASLKKAESK